MKWVKVSERLPENTKSWNLVITEYNEFYIAKTHFWERRNLWVFESDEGKTLINITHWQPLPEPPKGYE